MSQFGKLGLLNREQADLLRADDKACAGQARQQAAIHGLFGCAYIEQVEHVDHTMLLPDRSILPMRCSNFIGFQPISKLTSRSAT